MEEKIILKDIKEKKKYKILVNGEIIETETPARYLKDSAVSMFLSFIQITLEQLPLLFYRFWELLKEVVSFKGLIGVMSYVLITQSGLKIDATTQGIILTGLMTLLTGYKGIQSFNYSKQEHELEKLKIAQNQGTGSGVVR